MEDASTEGEGEKTTDVKKLIYIRAEHLLNITLTKTTLDLFQRIQTMFNDLYKKGTASDDDQEQAMVSIFNQTGYELHLHQIKGLKFSQDAKEEDGSEKNKDVYLKSNETLHLTIPGERLKATHLPSITEQVAKRKQQFQLEVRIKLIFFLFYFFIRID